MLVLVVFLAALLPPVSAAALDPNCTQPDPVDGSLKIAPSATVCSDKIPSTACKQMFGGTAGVAVVVGDAASTSRAPNCFQIALSPTTGTPTEDVKKAAVDLCANFCGFCCVSSEYSCENARNPRINCAQITKDMCQSIEWREIIAQDCPNTCGFCLLGGCIDAAPDCAKQATICANPALAPFANTNCKRTCNQCDNGGSSTTTAFGLIGGGGCGDSNPNCATWVRNGFCTSNFYNPTQKATTCGRSCGLCGGR